MLTPGELNDFCLLCDTVLQLVKLVQERPWRNHEEREDYLRRLQAVLREGLPEE